jgi:hypothetical protein
VSGNAESVAADLAMVYCNDSVKRPNTQSQSGSRFLVPMLLKSRLGYVDSRSESRTSESQLGKRKSSSSQPK